MTHRVNIIYVNLQSIYGHLYTFGYLGNDRSGFEAIPRGLSRLNLVLYWIYTQNALASSILTSVGLFRARRWPWMMAHHFFLTRTLVVTLRVMSNRVEISILEVGNVFLLLTFTFFSDWNIYCESTSKSHFLKAKHKPKIISTGSFKNFEPSANISYNKRDHSVYYRISRSIIPVMRARGVKVSAWDHFMASKALKITKCLNTS